DGEEGAAAHREGAVDSVEAWAGESHRPAIESGQGLRGHTAAVETDESARGRAVEAASHVEDVASDGERAARGAEQIGGETLRGRRRDMVQIASNAHGLVRAGE